MDNLQETDIFPEFEFETESNQTNSISLSDVFEFILNSNEEDVRRIISFCSSKSGLCSIKDAAEQRGIKPPSYCQNDKYEKFDFLGKTYGLINIDSKYKS